MPQPPLVLPVVEYAPDLPALQGAGSMNVRNVIPRTPLSYGPMPNPVVFSGALGARCQGCAAYIDTSGNVTVFAGDDANLYSLSPASTTWSAISKSSDAYSTTADGNWNAALFGARVLLTNFSDPIQSFTLGSSTTFTDLASAAPKARYMATIKSFLMVGNTSDDTNGAQPQRIWWAANNDPTNWPTPGTAEAAEFQSDFNDLVGEGGWVQGIVGNLGTADGAVFQERAVWRVVYEGPPATFGFYPAEGVRGCPAPASIVQFGNIVYYLGQDAWYAFDGTSSRAIGANKVDKTFFSDLDQSNIFRVVGAADPINKLILWAYPGAGNSNGDPNRLLIYNWQLDRWSIADLTIETLCRVLSFGYTLDELYTTLGYTIDDLPFNFDSRVWTGGKLLLGCFDQNHKLNYFNGSSMAATIDTAETQPFPGLRAKVRNARPLVDGGTPSVAIATRNRLVDDATVGSAVAMNSLGTCPLRADGRYIRGEITIPVNADWSHAQGIELEVSPGGVR